MSQHYSDPERESDPYALPDVEVFYADEGELPSPESDPGREMMGGWYWWSCFPGCLPDSDPFGPFDSEAEALADAQERNA